MKLYKIFDEVILEQKQFEDDKALIIKIIEELRHKLKFINESVSETQVIDAINNKYNVNILYRDYEDLSIPPSKRYIQVYLLGTTKTKDGKGNRAIRAYQISGGSKHDEKNGWRMFRLDKIEGWFPTKMKFNTSIDTKDSSIPTYKSDDKKFASRNNYVEFGNEPKAVTQPQPTQPQKKNAYQQVNTNNTEIKK